MKIVQCPTCSSIWEYQGDTIFAYRTLPKTCCLVAWAKATVSTEKPEDEK